MTHLELVQSKLLRMEATALFAQIEQLVGPCTRSISDYRAYLYMPREIAGIPVDVYFEREAHIAPAAVPGAPALDSRPRNLWVMNIEIEGRGNESHLLPVLETLKAEGYDVGMGSENLDRQMKFSLGLYGAAQMRLFVRPASDMPVFDSILRLVRFTDPVSADRAASPDDDYGFDDGVLFGDWQTWK